MKKIIYVTAITGLLLTTSHAHAWRDTYDDCIIKNISDGMSNLAINTLKQSCTSKHFESAPDSQKRNLIGKTLESFKLTDPDFYDWVILAREKYPEARDYQIIEFRIENYGYPKR